MLKLGFKKGRHEEGIKGFPFSLKPLAISLLLFILCLLMNANTAFAATVTLAWDAPTTNVDGSQLTDLAGHRLYYGTASGNYGQSIDVAGNVTTYTVTNLSDNTTYYFVVTARDTSNNESAYSNEECFNSAGSCGGSGGGGNQNASNTSGTEVSGGGCGFVKDDSDRWLKGQSVKSESSNILNLALLILLLTVLKLKVMLQQAIGGYNKMNKIFSAMVFSLILFNNPAISYAAVNLPWSTTYKCPEWTWDGANNALNCDGISNDTGGTCDNGVGREQITAVANYPSGGGGKGQRHWIGDGVNNVSGGLYLSLSSPQSEIWIRWYMRYEAGFQWAELVNQKIIYFDPVSFPRLIVEYYGQNNVQIYSYAVNQGWPSVGNGWNAVMANGGTDANGNKTSDGQWHLWEFHVKIDTNGSNGILELWIDQKKVINVNNANLAAAPLSNVLIGSNGFTPGNGRCMYVDYDDIAISNTGPIGPICPDCPNSPNKLYKKQ